MRPLLSLCILGAAWAFAVYMYGAEEPTPGRCAELGIALAAVVLWVSPLREKRSTRLRMPDTLLAALLLLIALLQLIPLPLQLLRVLSPHRAAQVSAAATVLGPISYAPLSAVPAATRDAVLTLAAYLLVYLLACDLHRRLASRRWIAAAPILVVGALEAALGVVQSAGGTEALGTYVNRNHFSGLLEMSLPFALMFGFHVLNRPRRGPQIDIETGVVACLFFAMAALMLVAVVDSHSRMGFIATLAGLFACAASGLWSRSRGGFRGGAFTRFWLPLAAIAALVPIAFVFLSSDQMISRFHAPGSPEAFSEQTRRQIWKESLPLIADYKLAGCGLGAYESCFLPYKSVAPNYVVDRAHNDYIQLMAELGIPGFACILGLALTAYASALRRDSLNSSSRYFAIACVGSLTAILLHSFVDFNLYVPANGMLAAWVAGLARES